MASSYPAGLDSFVNPTDLDTMDDPPHATQHADVNDAVEAVQAELGLNPRGSEATVRARLDAQLGLLDVVYITADDTFDKGDYAGLVKVRVTVVGGGGGGGGAEVTAGSEFSGGGGGGGGGHSIKMIDEATLGASETVTVGAGGAGNSGAAGDTGGTSSFGAHCDASGGVGGVVKAAGSADNLTYGSAPGLGSGGDINGRGGAPGDIVQVSGGSRVGGGLNGADSILGKGPQLVLNATGSAASANTGAGGGGMRSGPSHAARIGGAGGSGLVIVEVYGAS